MVKRRRGDKVVSIPRPKKDKIHRDPLQREADLQEVAKLTRLGYNQAEIVVKLDGRVCHQQVSYDLETIRKRHLDSIIDDRRVLALEALEVIRLVRKEAYLAWMKSQEDEETLVDESQTGNRGASSRQTHKKKGQVGNPEFLKIIRDTVKDERELLGLDEAVKIDITSEGNRINWHELCQPQVIKVDPIEEIIRQEREQGLLGMKEEMESVQDNEGDNG